MIVRLYVVLYVFMDASFLYVVRSLCMRVCVLYVCIAFVIYLAGVMSLVRYFFSF